MLPCNVILRDRGGVEVKHRRPGGIDAGNETLS
jgi:hypothetical protein